MPLVHRSLINKLKRRLEHYSGYKLAKRLKTYRYEHRVVSLVPKAPSRGDALLSYHVLPFLLRKGEPLPNTHTHFWESREMAFALLDLGYAVDVITYVNTDFRPRKDYGVVIDVRWNLQRLAPILSDHCTRILHIDTCHLAFQNAAEMRRLLAVQERRGVTLRPRRFEMPNLGIEYAHHATVLGNEATARTYRYAGKPIHRIPISSPLVLPWRNEKKFDRCRRNFLWLGSSGLVHKGLDLVLEAFAQMPEMKLTVCGPINNEQDFEQAYWRELYETPNIRCVGWVDVGGLEFAQIVENALAIVYPSASEGGAGCVITCMHAGLIPIVTYEASVDVSPEYGVLLREASIDGVQRAVTYLADLPADTLARMARNAWEYARSTHTREVFATVLRRTLSNILAVEQS